MNRENIKTFIVVLIICALCAGLALFLNRKTNYQQLTYATDYGEFFSISNYVNKYVDYVSNKKNNAIYSLLDKKYIEEKLITKENLLEKIGNYHENLSINITEIKYADLKKNRIYYIKGEFIENNYDSKKNTGEIFESLLLLDNKNLSYSIYPLDGDLKRTINSIKKIDVEKNNYNNQSINTKVNKERMCTFYLSNYIDYLFNNKEKAYELLSNDMKKSSELASFDNFKEFITKNLKNITTTCDKCNVEEYKDETVYSVIDKKGNKYIFTEKNILNYKVNMYINSASNK